MGVIRVAACHASPVFLSARETTEKAISLIREAAEQKANLVVFAETYIPAFPIWSALRPPTHNHELFKRMARESVYADGEEVGAIRAAARQLGIMVSIGISEKVRTSSATLYNSNLFIGADGAVLVHHRKLMPTFYEKLTWAPGDGHGLRVADTPLGKIGTLICGENTNPLARYALMAQGEQLHISSWPAVWPTRLSGSGSANFDNVSANRTRAAAHCFEAKCFGVLCSGFLGADAIEAVASGADNEELITRELTQSKRGATMFLDPTGAPLPGFVVNKDTSTHEQKEMLQEQEGILYVDMDLDDGVEGKQYHDVVGGYQRLDVFELRVDRTRHHPANFVERTIQAATETTQDTRQDKGNVEVL